METGRIKCHGFLHFKYGLFLKEKRVVVGEAMELRMEMTVSDSTT